MEFTSFHIVYTNTIVCSFVSSPCRYFYRIVCCFKTTISGLLPCGNFELECSLARSESDDSHVTS